MFNSSHECLQIQLSLIKVQELVFLQLGEVLLGNSIFPLNLYQSESQEKDRKHIADS